AVEDDQVEIGIGVLRHVGARAHVARAAVGAAVGAAAGVGDVQRDGDRAGDGAGEGVADLAAGLVGGAGVVGGLVGGLAEAAVGIVVAVVVGGAARQEPVGQRVQHVLGPVPPVVATPGHREQQPARATDRPLRALHLTTLSSPTALARCAGLPRPAPTVRGDNRPEPR